MEEGGGEAQGTEQPSLKRHKGSNSLPWTDNQDKALCEVVQEVSSNQSSKRGIPWNTVIKQLNTQRSVNQIKARWHLLSQRSEGRNEGAWTPEEDMKMLEGMAMYDKQGRGGSVLWEAVGAYIGSRSVDQCRKRWHNTLKHRSSKVKTGTWTAEEDRILIEAVSKCLAGVMESSNLCDTTNNQTLSGQTEQKVSWQEVAASFNGRRTAHQCSMRWNMTLKRRFQNIKCGMWDSDEDDMLEEAVVNSSTEGKVDWLLVSDRLHEMGVRRSSEQCAQRHRDSIRHSEGMRTGAWTEEETNKLLTAVSAYTVQRSDSTSCIDFNRVAKDVGSRNRAQCYTRYVYIKKQNLNMSAMGVSGGSTSSKAVRNI